MTPAARPHRDDPEYYEGRALGLLASAGDGTASAVRAFARHDAPRTEAGARLVLAREHGCASWDELIRRVAGLRAADDPFVRAHRVVEARDVAGLEDLVDRFPELVATRGTNGNDLLGMAAATCDERLVAVLLRHGADVAAANVHGWTALHQAAYADLPVLARMLLDAGAPVDVAARGDGGTPLVVALFWGNRTTAELLAGHGLHPPNLRVAAGLGRLDVVGELVAPGGRPAPAAACGRPRRSGGWSSSAPIRTGARRSAAPRTARASPRSTSRRRTGTSTRSARCSSSARTRRCATRSTTGPPQGGPSTAGAAPRQRSCARPAGDGAQAARAT